MSHDIPSTSIREDYSISPDLAAKLYEENRILPAMRAFREVGKTNEEITNLLDKMLLELPDGLDELAKNILCERRDEILQEFIG
ncbi:MAG: hypothetical protein LBQ11_02820 [Candidatus Nomurabacteria bacterium]|jgi:hypothetical protein|nr:hypothetical protein [Candidatus Nomurabacteria bacterium]